MRCHLYIGPPLWRCGLRRNFHILQQQDIQTISTTLLNKNGVTERTPLFYENHPARKFCMQYGESDLALLARLRVEGGVFFFERFVAGSLEQKLTLCGDVAGLSQTGELPFNPGISAGAETECISMFRHEAHIRPLSVQSQDHTFRVPNWPGMYEQQGEDLNGQLEQYEIFDYPGRYKDEQRGKDFMLYRMESLRSDTGKATGQSNSLRLRPGTWLTLMGHLQKVPSREWQVVQSILSGDQPQALHDSQERRATLGSQLEVIPADWTWHPRLRSKPKVDGPQSATIAGPAEEEILYGGHGRVRMKFHWDRYNPAAKASLCWVRVLQVWAGPEFDNLVIPRVSQEVIADFSNGDPDQLIVMGWTYHGGNRLPESLPGTKTQMTIRSKTCKGGGFNELRLEDVTGGEQVYIHTQKNMDVEALSNRTMDVKADHTETVGSDQKVTVGLGQTVGVGSEKEGSYNQRVMVVNDQHLTIKNDRHKVVNNNQTSKVTGTDTKEVVKKQDIKIGDNYEPRVEHGTNIISGDSIGLICGQGENGTCSIKLEKTRKIIIRGMEFLFEAAGPIDIKGKDIHLNGQRGI